MTPAEIETRFAVIEREMLALKWEMLRMAGVQVLPGIGPVGRFADDPTFEEAVRLGREGREQVNRESLEEMDREEREQRAMNGPVNPSPDRPVANANP